MLKFVTVSSPEQFGIGDGATTSFQLVDGSTQVQSPVSEQIYRNDWQGNQMLYTTARANLLEYSQDFTKTGAWGSQCVVTPNATTAPDGTNSAQLVADASTTINASIFQNATVVNDGGTYAVSFYFKAGTTNLMSPRLEFFSGGTTITYACNINPNTLAITSNSFASTSIVFVGNGWYRFTGVGSNNASGNTVAQPQLYVDDGPVTDTSNIYLWGFQIEKSATSTSYIPTTTAAVTVTDYTLASNGLVTLASAPVEGAAMTWTGKYSIFVPDTFPQSPLQQVVPSYVYAQYADDPDIQAFFASVNEEGQGYLDWFLTTPLSVYTSPNINGPLLDWIGQGIYGISRPVISSITTKAYGPYNTEPYNFGPYGSRKVVSSGSATIANDDIYKRTLTWHLYLGDGRQMSVQWLRRRVARFIYGTNGADVSASEYQNIGIVRAPSGVAGSLGIGPYNTQAYNSRAPAPRLTRHAIQISVPSGAIGQTFRQLMNQGELALPFQVKFSVVFH
jgi:hypothetical protein